MPICMEQWRTSVGCNNAARSTVLAKCTGKKTPKSFFGQFLTFLLALFSPGAGLVTNNGKRPDYFGRVIVNVISVLTLLVSSAVVIPAPTTLCVHSLTKRHGSARKSNWRGCWRLLCLLFSISVAACLLSRSGDVESKPWTW